MRRRRSLPLEYVEALAIAVLLAIFARTFVLQAFKIPTDSMESNLLVGDHLVVNKLIYAPSATLLERILVPSRPVRRGDVVAFKYPEDPTREFIKRCVGLPGDRIEIVEKRLRVNGSPIDETSYVLHEDQHVYPASRFLDESIRQRDNFGPYTVPAGHYFCLGDNRDLSNDSRFWGPVPSGHITGRAVLVYWSVRPDPAPTGRQGWGRRLLGLAGFFGRVESQIRWDRCFHLVR